MRSRKHSQQVAYAIGVVFFASTAGFLYFGTLRGLRTPGPFTAGHEELACESCHQAAPGTFRQQAQANFRWLINQREEPVDVGAMLVPSSACTDCHDRPNDRHPSFRFFEPRFQSARKEIAPERCASCHREHSNARVTVEADFCRHCHAGIVVDSDPIDFPHELLARIGDWNRCLGCHDFHGNHEREAPQRTERAIAPSEIKKYFAGGPTPYAQTTKVRARRVSR